MADLPEVGLNAVIENLASFEKAAASIREAFGDINTGADSVEDTTAAAGIAISALGGVASTVASGGMTLLVSAVAAVAAAGLAAVASIGLVAKASFDLSSDIEASQKKIQSQLGVTESKAEELGETAVDVWANNFAGSVEEATAALIETRQQLKGLSDEELQDATENAIRLSDAFGIDIAESTNAANVLMTEFGLSQQEAFDFITEGFQKGLNSSDDFLDSIGEYGNLFGQAGGDAGQFFSLFESGLQGGVLGTDKAADAFKEFSIRIIDGSDTTSDALNDLFLAVDGIGGEIAALEKDYDAATVALEDNARALEESEGAFAATETIVKELETALEGARRELEDLSRPDLAGMQEFDDVLFGLDQQSNKLRLSMLDMIPESDVYKAAQEQLDAINTEMDRVALERDIQFEPQLRAIEKAATGGLEPLQTYDQVMVAIGAKKTEISGLEGAFNAANKEMEANAATVGAIKTAQGELISEIEFLEQAMEGASTPASEFLDGFIDGSLTGVDAMQQVIAKLNEVEDPIERNRIGVSLFGTQFEDLGAEALLALDLTKTSLEDVAGATDTLNAQYETLPQVFEGVKRQMLLAIRPIGDSILEAANEIIPLLFDAIEDLKPVLADFAVIVGDSVTAAVQELIPWIKDTLVPALQEFGKWLVTTGLPALKDFAAFIWNDVIPVIVTFVEWIGDELIPFIQDLWKLFKAGKKQGKTVSKAFDGILKSIQPLVKKVLPLLLDLWETIKKWTEKNWPLIKKVIETVMNGITKVIERNIKIITDFWDKWGDEIMKITDFIFKTIAKIVKVALENLLSIITVIMKVITGDWKGAWDEITKIIKRSVNAILDIAKDAFELLRTLAKSIVGKIVKDFLSAWNKIRSDAKKALNDLRDIVVGILTDILNSAGKIINDLRDLLIGIWSKVKSDAEKALNDLKTTMSNIWNEIKDKVLTIVTNMIDAIVSKFNTSVDAIKEALISMLTKAINAVVPLVKDLAGIAEIVTNLVTSIGDKIAAAWTTIKDGIMEAITTALDLFSLTGDALDKIGEMAGEIMTALKDKIAALWQDIKTGITSAVSTAFSLFSIPGDVLNKLIDVGKDIIQGIIEGINDAKETLRDILKDVIDLLPQWLRDFLGIGSPAKLLIPIGKSAIEGVQAGITAQVPSLLSQMRDVAAGVVAAPALGATSTTTVTNVFNTGGNTVASEMDAVLFEQRVLQVITSNL